MKKDIDIIQVSFALGSHRRGADLGAKAIEYEGLTSILKQNKFEIYEKSLIFKEKEDELHPSLKNYQAVFTASHQIYQSVYQSIQNEHFPLIVGGDHSISIGSIAGVAQKYDNLGVIWVDAHGDVNTPETTPSGNIHGMPLAINLGYGEQKFVNLATFAPKVKAENTVLLGVRELDEGEIAFLQQQKIEYFTMDEVKRMGISTIMKRIEGKFQHLQHIHLSFDLDALDPSIAPGVGTPVDEGLSYQEAQTILFSLKKWNKLVSSEFVEVNPLFDIKNQTAKVAVQLMETLFTEK